MKSEEFLAVQATKGRAAAAILVGGRGYALTHPCPSPEMGGEQLRQKEKKMIREGDDDGAAALETEKVWGNDGAFVENAYICTMRAESTPAPPQGSGSSESALQVRRQKKRKRKEVSSHLSPLTSHL